MAKNGRPLFDKDQQSPIVAGTPQLDPFGNPRPNPFDAVVAASPEEVYEIAHAYDRPIPILPPRHLEAPEGARTINLMSMQSIGAGATVTLFNFAAIIGATTVFNQYSLISNAPQNSAISWVPSINRRRVFEYHGDPANNQLITHATAPDFSDIGLVSCQLIMQTGQYFTWTVTNGTGAAVLMGVRMVGYIDMSQRLVSSKFGD